MTRKEYLHNYFASHYKKREKKEKPEEVFIPESKVPSFEIIDVLYEKRLRLNPLSIEFENVNREINIKLHKLEVK
jgi:hypothetical protein